MRKSKLAAVAVIVILLVGAFALFRAHSAVHKPAVAGKGSQAQSRTFTIGIASGKVSSGPTRLTVHQGDSVVINVTADQAAELHLHGYDKEVELEPGVTQKLAFKATMPGQFEAELHTTDATVFVLEVEPR